MAVVQSIATLLLKPLVGDVAEKVVAALTDHWTDHGERLVKALRTANERAWKAFEVALAGDSWWQQIKGLLANKEDETFSRQVRAFLDGLPMPDLAGRTRFREQCLRELQQARRNQDLTKGELTAAALRAQARPLAWRKFLRECVAHPQTRLPDFAAVLKLLNKIKPRKAPKQAGKTKMPVPATVPSTPRAYSMACPHCRKGLRLGAEHMGKTARCPHCSGVFRLPAVGVS